MIGWYSWSVGWIILFVDWVVFCFLRACFIRRRLFFVLSGDELVPDMLCIGGWFLQFTLGTCCALVSRFLQPTMRKCYCILQEYDLSSIIKGPVFDLVNPEWSWFFPGLLDFWHLGCPAMEKSGPFLFSWDSWWPHVLELAGGLMWAGAWHAVHWWLAFAIHIGGMLCTGQQIFCNLHLGNAVHLKNDF